MPVLGDALGDAPKEKAGIMGKALVKERKVDPLVWRYVSFQVNTGRSTLQQTSPG